jgi:prolyl oligopeptidase
MHFHRRALIALGGIILTSLGCSSQESIEYPQTKQIDHTDTYHGVVVADPYRWLEQDVRESPEVAQWVEAQNKVTFAYLESIPQRAAIQEKLTALWDFEKYANFRKAGGRYVYLRNDGLQNQYVLYAKNSLDAEPRVLLDPNQWSADGTVALGEAYFSDDGKHATYSVAD